MEIKLPSNPVYGFASLAKVLNTTVGALHQARHRGTLGIKPVCNIGRTAVFDGDQVQVYAEQRRKQAKG